MGFLPSHIITLYAICFLINLSIGIFVLTQNVRNPSNRFFFYFAISHVLWIASLFLGYSFIKPYNEVVSTFFIRLAYGIPAFMYFLLPAFFYFFPRVSFRMSKPLRLGLLSFAAVSFALISFTSLVHSKQVLVDGNYVADTFGPLYIAYIIYLLAAMILGAAFAIRKALTLHGFERRKIMFSLIGAIAFLFTLALTNVILPLFGIYFMVQESPALSLLFTIPTLYSMQKHRFFDISLNSLRIVRMLTLGVIFVSIIILIDNLLQSTYSGLDAIFTSIISSLIALFVFKKIEKRLPEMVTSSFREFRDSIEQLKSDLYQCSTYDELLYSIESIFVTRLQIANSRILLVREHDSSINFPVYLRNGLVEELERKKYDILVFDELQFASDPATIRLHDYMLADDMQICLPLYLEKTVVGLLVLGNKTGDSSYSREEIEELLNMKHNLELCFINILIRSNLQEENNLMKQVIDEKTRNLRIQNKKIKNLLRQQADFIAVTAHEFRTPLNIALLQLEDTLESYSHAGEVLEEMKHVETALMRLKNLTQKLFDVQQYDLGKVRLQNIDTNATSFLKSIFDEFHDLMEQKKIDFTLKNNLSGSVSLSIDEPQMRQVFHNLLTNAFKFTPESGKIIFSVDDLGDRVEFHIADNGKGIPDEDKKRIFEKFQTAKVSMGMGIGLGLYICKKIVELHKGTIEVRDTQTSGADFVVTLRK